MFAPKNRICDPPGSPDRRSSSRFDSKIKSGAYFQPTISLYLSGVSRNLRQYRKTCLFQYYSYQVLVVVVKQRNNISKNPFTINRQRNILSAFVDVVNRQFIAAVISLSINRFPILRQSGTNVQPIIAALQSQYPLIIADHCPSRCAGLP